MVLNLGAEDVMTGLSQTSPTEFSFVGHGMHGVMQPMDGDFTATCRVDDYATSGVHRDAWIGLAAFERSDGRNWNFGKGFYLVQTSGDGIRTSADSSDLGGSRKSSFRLPADHSWFRITRQGDLLMGWTSKDGQEWIPGGTYQHKMNERMVCRSFRPYQRRVGEFLSRQGFRSGRRTGHCRRLPLSRTGHCKGHRRRPPDRRGHGRFGSQRRGRSFVRDGADSNDGWRQIMDRR